MGAGAIALQAELTRTRSNTDKRRSFICFSFPIMAQMAPVPEWPVASNSTRHSRPARAWKWLGLLRRATEAQEWRWAQCHFRFEPPGRIWKESTSESKRGGPGSAPASLPCRWQKQSACMKMIVTFSRLVDNGCSWLPPKELSVSDIHTLAVRLSSCHGSGVPIRSHLCKGLRPAWPGRKPLLDMIWIYWISMVV